MGRFSAIPTVEYHKHPDLAWLPMNRESQHALDRDPRRYDAPLNSNSLQQERHSRKTDVPRADRQWEDLSRATRAW